MTKRHRQVEASRQAGARSTPALVTSRARVATSDSSSDGSESGSDDAHVVPEAPLSKSDLHLADGNSTATSDDDFDSSEIGDDGNMDDDRSSEIDEESAESTGIEATDAEDDDEEEDGDDEKEITVHFDVNEMASGDAAHLYHLMDQLVPDHMEEVDRDQLGEALLASPYTSVVKLGGEDSADETEVFGLFSLLDVAHGLRGPQKKSFAALVKLLREGVWQVTEPGIASVDVLTSFADEPQQKGPAAVAAEDRRSKAVLLVQEYIRNVPLELTSRILQHSLTSFRHDAQRWSKKRDKAIPLFTVFPCMFVVLAKIQRSADSVKRSSKRDGTPLKKKGRKEATSTSFDMSEFIFWREEDETLFSFRDKRVAVAAYRCRAQYDGQPQSEIPITLSFALTNEGLEQAAAAIKNRETIVPLGGDS